MKDLVIYDKQRKIILAIITNYKSSDDIMVLNKNIDTYIVDSYKNYILTDEQTRTIRFVNPDNKVLYMEDYK